MNRGLRKSNCHPPVRKQPSIPRAEEAVVSAAPFTVVRSGGKPVTCRFNMRLIRSHTVFRRALICIGKALPPTVSDFTLFTSALKAACKNLIEAEPDITQYDTSELRVLLDIGEGQLSVYTDIPFSLLSQSQAMVIAV